MLQYPNSYNDAVEEIKKLVDQLRNKGHHIFYKEKSISPQYQIREITIKSTYKTKNTLVFSTGLHGIEGYVGHACLMTFFKDHFRMIDYETDIIIYHIVNPYGMDHYERTNELNIDLNRNFLEHFNTTPSNFSVVEKFLYPHQMKSMTRENTSFYYNLSKLIRQHGVNTLTDAIMFGQNKDYMHVYYTGVELQPSTKYMIEECERILDMNTNVTWIDIHTGYGPRNQMSIYNSKYEKHETRKMKAHISYPRFLGLDTEDIYDSQGDMIEYLYKLKKGHNHNKSFYACCYEFGTLGESTKHAIDSLKTLTFNNSIRFFDTTERNRKRIKNAMKELFMPSSNNWKRKAQEDFYFATKEILAYKKLVK